jgi:hypothetical protein
MSTLRQQRDADVAAGDRELSAPPVAADGRAGHRAPAPRARRPGPHPPARHPLSRDRAADRLDGHPQTREIVRAIDKLMRQSLARVAPPDTETVSGVQSLAQILTQGDRSTERDVLDGLRRDRRAARRRRSPPAAHLPGHHQAQGPRDPNRCQPRRRQGRRPRAPRRRRAHPATHPRQQVNPRRSDAPRQPRDPATPTPAGHRRDLGDRSWPSSADSKTPAPSSSPAPTTPPSSNPHAACDSELRASPRAPAVRPRRATHNRVRARPNLGVVEVSSTVNGWCPPDRILGSDPANCGAT